MGPRFFASWVITYDVQKFEFMYDTAFSVNNIEEVLQKLVLYF